MHVNHHIFLEALASFIRSAQHEALSLFNRLDIKLNPQVILLVIPIESETKDKPITILPPECGYSLDWFLETQPLVHQLSRWDLSALEPQIRRNISVIRRDIKLLVQDILLKKSSQLGASSFTVLPALIYGYSVSLILQVSQDTLASYYTLSKNACRKKSSKTSLLYELAYVFLYRKVTQIRNLSRYQTIYMIMNQEDEYLRKAGYFLMRTIEDVTENNESTSLFHACNMISSLFYEGNVGSGSMIISRRTHPKINLDVQWRDPVEINNHRGIRKLLEITTRGLNLLCDASHVYGVGQVDEEEYDESQEDLFVIEFTDHYTWKLLHADNELMEVSYGLPKLPAKLLSRQAFKRMLSQTFPEMSQNALKRLWRIFKEASHQKSGTMVVISDHAKEEAERLKGQSTPIFPIHLTHKLILPLSAIDGAILIDQHGICYAIGVILDGQASGKGNRARGARYNSAIQYIDYAVFKKHSCIIVVVSEDGMINLI